MEAPWATYMGVLEAEPRRRRIAAKASIDMDRLYIYIYIFVSVCLLDDLCQIGLLQFRVVDLARVYDGIRTHVLLWIVPCVPQLTY